MGCKRYDELFTALETLINANRDAAPLFSSLAGKIRKRREQHKHEGENFQYGVNLIDRALEKVMPVYQKHKEESDGIEKRADGAAKGNS